VVEDPTTYLTELGSWKQQAAAFYSDTQVGVHAEHPILEKSRSNMQTNGWIKKKIVATKNKHKMFKTKTDSDMCVGAAHPELGKLVHAALGGDKMGSLGSCGFGSPVFYECVKDDELLGTVPVYGGMGEVAKIKKQAESQGITCTKHPDIVFS
tara:strand:+ start:1645 stop:2103 length:459 start_codon:yes stop_codon:yes gene_type:complete